MENRKQLTARLCTLDPSIQEEDVLLAYGFDLLPDATRVRCDGIAVLLKDRYLLFQDGKQILSLPLEQVKEKQIKSISQKHILFLYGGIQCA